MMEKQGPAPMSPVNTTSGLSTRRLLKQIMGDYNLVSLSVVAQCVNKQ